MPSEVVCPHCENSPTEPGCQFASGRSRSIASVGARQNASFWLRTSCCFALLSRLY